MITLDELPHFEELKQLVDSQLDLTNNLIQSSCDRFNWRLHWLGIPERKKPWLTQEVFNKYHSETNMMRYINELVSKRFLISKWYDATW